MNHVGMKENHKARFGMGIIFSQSENIHVTVKLDAFPDTKGFVASVCFTSFLQFLDNICRAAGNRKNSGLRKEGLS